MYLLGGLAGILALWFMLQAAEGLGYAFPRHPAAIDPSRARSGAQILAALIVAGLTLSLIVPLGIGQPLKFSPLHLIVAAALLVPLWELMTADVYKGTFLIVNADPETARPALIAAVSEVFGSVVDDKDMLVASDWEGDDFRVLVDERARLIVLNPTFRIPAIKVLLLMKALAAKLKTVKSAGFNERSFWIAFALPLALTVLYAGVAFLLLSSKASIPLRGTLGF
jgi:hypothetical protein